MRELDAILKQIDKRKHNEISIQASFHGIKIPMKGMSDSAPKVEFSESQTMAMEKAMQEAKLRKAREFERKHG